MSNLDHHQSLETIGYIYDEQGHLLVDTSTQEPVYKMSIDPLGARLVNSSNSLFEWREGELLAGRAIIVGRQSIGAICIGLSTAHLQQTIATVRNRGIKIAIVAVVTSVFLAQ